MRQLRRGLRIESGEAALVGWSAATLFLIEWASVAVSNASDAMFLKRVGIQYLPVVFLVNSLLLTLTTLAAGRVSVRVDHRRLLGATFLALASVLGVLWLLVVLGVPGIPTMLILASKQIEVIASLIFWTVLGSLLTSRQGKRLVALMTAGGTVGTIFGSFSSGWFGRSFGTASLLAVAGITFVLAAMATVPLVRSARRPNLLRKGPRPATTEMPDQQPRLRSFWADSRLFRVLAVTSFLAGTLGPMLYFEFSLAADLATRTADGEQKLLSLYGMLRGWINVGVLAVQVGGSAFLFRRIGVPLAAVLSPAAYLMGFAGLSVRFGLPTAMPATMGTSVIDHTIYEPAQRILSALLPLRIRIAATSFIQGPAKRAGAALGCVLILAVVALGDATRIAWVGLPIAAAWTLLAWWLWSNYPNLLLEAASVRHGDADDDPAATFLDPVTVRTLQGSLEGEDPGFCRSACALLADAPAHLAVDSLTRAIGSGSPHRTLLLETLEQVLAAAGAVNPTSRRAAASLARALAEPASMPPLEHAKLLQILGRSSEGRVVSDDVRRRLEAARESGDIVVRFASEIACRRVAPAGVSSEAFDTIIAEALESGDPDCRSIALAELRYELLRGDDAAPAWRQRLDVLATHLRADGPSPAASDSSEACARDHGCPQAVQALADVATLHQAAVAPAADAVLELADDPDPAVRAAVLRFIGNAGMVERASLLADRLASRSVVEAHAASRALEQLGPAAVHAMLHALRHGGRRGRQLVPPMLKEIRPDGSLLVMLIDREIELCRGLVVVLAALDQSPVSRLLLQRIRERIDESSRVILELLSALLDDERIAKVCRSLGRSWNVRDRSVLLEALEALLPPLERERILPLLEDHGGSHRLATQTAAALGRRWPTMEEAIAQAIASRDALTNALIAATVDRELLARIAPELDVDAALRLFAPKRRIVTESDESGGRVAAVREEEPMLSPVETMLHLRALDLFEGLSTAQLSELARVVVEVKVPDGTAIVTEGTYDDDSMYFIVEGTVRIERGGLPVAELGAHDFFGEMAAFDGETRSATATAVGEVRLLSLARVDLFEVIEDQPAIGIGICQTLARRLRGMLKERSPAEKIAPSF